MKSILLIFILLFIMYLLFSNNNMETKELKKIKTISQNAQNVQNSDMFSELDIAKKKTSTGKLVGISFSGGGARAATCCRGTLYKLFKDDLLDSSKIQFVSGNSGATWVIGSLVYYNTKATHELSDVFKSIEDNIINVENSVWDWNGAINNSFYKNLGLGNPNDYWAYVKPRGNLPIPIMIQTQYFPNIDLAVPFDSTPYSFGYLNTNYNFYNDYFPKKTNLIPKPYSKTGCYGVDNTRRQFDCLEGSNYTKLYTGDWDICDWNPFDTKQVGYCGNSTINNIQPVVVVKEDQNSKIGTIITGLLQKGRLSVNVDGKIKDTHMPQDGVLNTCELLLKKQYDLTDWKSKCEFNYAIPMTQPPIPEWVSTQAIMYRNVQNLPYSELFSGRLNTLEHPEWTLYKMSGTSSCAFGHDLLDNKYARQYDIFNSRGGLLYKPEWNLPFVSLTKDFDPIKNTYTPLDNYIIDGFTVDDTATMSLISRKVDKIVACSSPYLFPHDTNFIKETYEGIKEKKYYFLMPTSENDKKNTDTQVSWPQMVSYCEEITERDQNKNPTKCKFSYKLSSGEIKTEEGTIQNYNPPNIVSIQIFGRVFEVYDVHISGFNNLLNLCNFTYANNNKKLLSDDFRQLLCKNYYNEGIMYYKANLITNAPTDKNNDFWNIPDKHEVEILFVVMVAPWGQTSNSYFYNGMNPCTAYPSKNMETPRCQTMYEYIIDVIESGGDITNISELNVKQYEYITNSALYITQQIISPFLKE